MVLRGGTPALDQTVYLAYPGPTIKQNTADFTLALGGRLLLQSAAPGDNAGLQLQDGSGVLLLNTYIPQLGDPVTITNPTWSGRVVSVQTSNFVERQVNYTRAAVAAINATTAPGGTPPANFSDQALGAHLQLEDGSGSLLLQDGSYLVLQDGTFSSYRNLQLRKSQNQDGTTTTYGSLETFVSGYAAGMTIQVTNVDQQLAAISYTITNVTTSFIGANPMTPLYLIEFGDAYQTLQKAGGGVLTQQASTAVVQQGAAVPAGTLGYAQVTAAQTGITTIVDLTGLSVTVTVGGGRRIRVTAFTSWESTVTDDGIGLFLVEGSTKLGQTNIIAAFAGGQNPAPLAVTLTPTAGVHTYKLQGQRLFGTGSLTMRAGDGSTNPIAFLQVEDIGV